jgi:hypothetical protein
MKKSAWRLVLSAVLFAAWIGYLAYLALTTTDPIVLSRPQFLDADLYVVADVPADPAASDYPAGIVSVKEVIWARNAEDRQLKTIEVAGIRTIKDLEADLKKALEAAKSNPEPMERDGLARSAEKKFELEKKFIWTGPGAYILALSRPTGDSKTFTLTNLPRTPGFNGYLGRVYRDTPETRKQLALLTKEFH